MTRKTVSDVIIEIPILADKYSYQKLNYYIHKYYEKNDYAEDIQILVDYLIFYEQKNPGGVLHIVINNLF